MEPIAITGFAFRLPQGAEDESTFWSLLENGRNVMTPWPEDRGNLDSFYPTGGSAKNTVTAKGAHFIQGDPGAFDSPFFSITSKEAASMDPQQRWLLETSYRALENAGTPVESVAGTDTAVFASSMSEDYMRILSKDPDEAPITMATGTSPSILANKLSWYFDLRGPSIQINTACSSSMVSTDLACQSLWSGQTSMALIAGANAILSPELSLILSNMNFLSPDSRCYSFDHRANGYARGEGVIVLVLKRLRDAIKHGDMIRAVIRMTGSNQDGHTPGITQPSLTAQEELIRRVYKACNLPFGLTRYVEAHGTGTKIGDSTEAKALGRVFRSSRSPKEPLFIGSVKSNIGHLEGVSGLAGILKSILILERGIIPPNALFEKLNPKINAAHNNIKVPTTCLPWPADGLRRVSINSFGFGGTNGHLIMDDAWNTIKMLASSEMHRALDAMTLPKSTYLHTMTNAAQANGTKTNGVNAHTDMLGKKQLTSPKSDVNQELDIPNGNGTKMEEAQHESPCEDHSAPPQSSPEASKPRPGYQLFVWSAKDEAALKKVLGQYTEYWNANICGGSQDQMAKLVYTLAARRSAMAWRSFAVIGTHALDPPKSPYTLPASRGTRVSRERGLAFVFTGQGAQYAKMGLDLLQYQVFKSTLTRIAGIFCGLGAEWSVLDELRYGEEVNAPQTSQPLCTALQIALVDLFKSIGIVADVFIGHSSGEIAAAYAAGALSVESACKVSYYRGKLVGQLIASTVTPTAMMSVNVPEQEVDTYLERIPSRAGIHVACVNSPFNVTLSGDEAALDALKTNLDHDGIFVKKIKTGVAYHSPVMQQISEEYLRCLGSLDSPELKDGNVLEGFMVSSVTGQKISPSLLRNGQYWVDNLISPVRFSDALQYVAVTASRADGLKKITDYLEIGPHGALKRPVSDTLSQIASNDGRNFRYAPALSKFDSPVKTFLEVAGQLFVHGYPVSVTAATQLDSQSHNPPFLVNAPQYPFDHSQLYWHETRISRDWRQRKAVPKHLLGTRVVDWNPLEPRWRKMLDIQDMPWIADHVIGEDILFPATGAITIALEAVKQISSAHKVIRGYYIKEASFMKPIVVPTEGSTEVITHLHPLQNAYEKTGLRFEIRIFACINSYWSECFKATVHLEYEEGVKTEVDGGHERRTASQNCARDYAQATDSCIKHVGKQEFYEYLHKQGLKYGKAFALAEGISWDGDQCAIGHVETGPPTEHFDGIVHPAIFDAAFQMAVTAPSKGMEVMIHPAIPHKLHSTWVSQAGWQYPTTGQIRVLVTSKAKDVGIGIQASFLILADDGLLLCRAKNLEMAPVMAMGAGEKDETRTNLLHRIEWQAQLSLLGLDELRGHCYSRRIPEDESTVVDYCLQLEKVLRFILRHNADRLLETDWSTVPSHMKNYVAWISNQVKSSPESPENIKPEDLNGILADLKARRPSWRMFLDIAQNLESIVRGEIDVLEFLYSDSLVQDLYDDFIGRAHGPELMSYLQLLTHQHPGHKILEVGAGTGALTNIVLSTLREIEDRTKGLAFSEYVYTDVSPAFFGKARDQFGEYQDRMVFKTLDLEQDIIAQGFQSESYDVIFAGDVLHATKNLSATLRNLQRALRPGGCLIFHEIIAPDRLVMGLGFGILPGWWGSEESFRSWGPTITESEWDVVLRENGFSGNDLVIRDYKEDAAHYGSLIISTAAEAPKITVPEGSRVLIVVDGQDSYQEGLATLLLEGLFGSPEYRPQVTSLTHLVDATVEPFEYTVFLTDVGTEFLAKLSGDDFGLVKTWVQQTKNLLWVASTDPERNTYACSGIEHGFLRTIRAEFTSKRIISVSLEGGAQDKASCAEHISSIWNSTFRGSSPEVEYRVRDGQILTARLVEDVQGNKDLVSLLKPEIRTGPWLSGPSLKLDIKTRGQMETLYFGEDSDYPAELGPLEVEIESRAWAVNFRDMFTALDRLEENSFGADCSGIVTRVGAECKTIQPGDRVTMCVLGCMRTFPRANEWAVVKIPDSQSFEEACAVITPAITAWQSLFEVARLQKGEKVLIHSASGATGQLAVQIAQRIGAEVFATVGYDHKKQLLIDYYNIPAENIFYSRDTSFSRGIMRLTNGYGVDVVLNSLIGEGLLASWRCIAPFGRFVEIGKADIHANSSLPMDCFAKNVTFTAVDLITLFSHRSSKAQELLCKAMDLVADGIIHHPKPLHLYELNAVEDAFRYLQSGKNTGRIVIRVDPATEVQKHIVSDRAWRFDEKATYVVIGGFGGLGRSILKWMAKKGARHLIVLSKSGPASEAASKTLRDLSGQGVAIAAPKCDVSSMKLLSEALEDCRQSMPPIRGCINAAMALNDATFDYMSHEQWVQTIRSKVSTSWNLHTLLPDLDFFIMLASVSGVVGNPGQSNYAAGCTFQDSLARYRTSLGQNAISIDLGPVSTVGIIAETKAFQKTFDGFMIPVEEYELLSLLNICCDPVRRASSVAESQITMGLTTPADMLSRSSEPSELLQRPLFAYFDQVLGALGNPNTGDNDRNSNSNVKELFRQSESAEERARVVTEALAVKLARALSIEPSDVDVEQPLHSFGVDSLVAVELRNWIAKQFAADTPVFEIMGGRSVAGIGELVTKTSQMRMDAQAGGTS